MPEGIPIAWFSLLHSFVTVLARVVGVLAVAPIFGGRGVPVLARIGLAVFVAALLLGPVGEPGAGLGISGALDHPLGYSALAGEMVIGAAMGFIVLLFLSAVQIAGQLMDIPLGFGMVNVLDPQTQVSVPVLGQFQWVLAMLIFFTVNAHHGVLRAIAVSYETIPPGLPLLAEHGAPVILSVFREVFVLGVRLALPIVVTSFLTDVALAIVSRAVPQINVFLTGFPIKVMVGMFVIAVVLPAYVGLLGVTFGEGGAMMRSLRALLGR